MNKQNCYVIPKDKTIPWYDHLAWVLRAVSTDETRYILNHVLVDGNKIVATDGRRLHMLEADWGLGDGLYSAVKTPRKIVLVEATDAGTYPKYSQVIPDHFTQSFDICGDKQGNVAGRLLFKLGQLDIAPLFLPFVNDIFSCGVTQMEVRVNSSLDAIAFKDEIRLAIVMPMRVT